MKTVTLSEIRKHIKRCNRRGERYDWLGFTENKDLAPDVEALFILVNPRGLPAYNWVSGNEKLREMERDFSGVGK